MQLQALLQRLRRPAAQPEHIVREYGRDALLVWANILIAPPLARLGLRVGLRSEEQLAARMESDATAMRRRGYLVAKVETFSLPVVGAAPGDAASRYRVTYERSTTPERS